VTVGTEAGAGFDCDQEGDGATGTRRHADLLYTTSNVGSTVGHRSTADIGRTTIIDCSRLRAPRRRDSSRVVRQPDDPKPSAFIT